MVNQVEYNPFYQQTEIRDYCRANGIQMEAYSPMAHGRVGDSFVIQQIAQKYGQKWQSDCSSLSVSGEYLPHTAIHQKGAYFE